jgi:hypothetical protein
MLLSFMSLDSCRHSKTSTLHEAQIRLYASCSFHQVEHNTTGRDENMKIFVYILKC